MASSRILSMTNPLRSQLIEPSQYLENIKQIISVNQDKLQQSAQNMKRSIEKLDANIDLVKEHVSQLETAKTTLNSEIMKNEQELSQVQDTSKLDELQRKNQELMEEKRKIEEEISNKLNEINKLETSIQNKENDWNQNKKIMVDNLRDFQDNKLIPYINEINDIIDNTNASIEASNTKLLKILSTENRFGNDPFVSIGAKFQEKLVNTNDLFEGNAINHFGKKQIDEDIDDEIDIDDIDIDEIDIDDEDSEMRFGSEDDGEDDGEDESEDDSESDSDEDLLEEETEEESEEESEE